jgi:transcription elongation GreA/GreB family factor
VTGLDRKQALKAELVARLSAALDVARAAHGAALEGATHEQARAENDKDTRGLEQSYLARGQAARILELEVALASVTALVVRSFGDDEPAGLGAVVEVEDAGGRRVYWIAAHGGGETLMEGGVQVVTPRSPIGRALLGRQVGDTAQVRVASRTRELEVVAIE